MRARPLLPTFLFALGCLLALAAAGLLVVPRPRTGFEDLAALAGAVFLGGLAGLAFGAYLLAARLAGGPAPPTWRLAVAALGSLAGLSAGAMVVSVNPATALFLGVPLVLVTLGGVGLSLPLWRRAKA